jgi:serine protease Do
MSRISKLFITIIIGVGAGWLGYKYILSGSWPHNATAVKTIYQEATSSSVQSAAAQENIAVSRQSAIVTAVRKASPAVVSISITQVVKMRTNSPFFDDPFFDNFFAPYRKEYYRRYNVPYIGSGFIINAQGYVLTNFHVVENAEKVEVMLPDRSKHAARIVGEDREHDIALLKMGGDNFPCIVLGTSGDLMIGEWAIALGNPFGLVLDDPHPSVTVGVVSALNRDFKPDEGRIYKDMIQTDASINPGNSGGPLLNSQGECIGINTFIFSNTGGSMGIGFAIPINRAKEIVDEINKYGRVREAWTGLTVQNLDIFIAQSLGLASTQGAIISYIARRSPGETAGLAVGDVITAVNGKPVKDTAELRNEFLGARVGDTFKLDIIRAGKNKSLTLKLAEMPQK